MREIAGLLAAGARVNSMVLTLSPRVATIVGIALASLLGACGGGNKSDSAPAEFSEKTVTGVVSHAGRAMANAQIDLRCSDGSGGVRTWVTVTDSQGAYSKRADTAYAPCVVLAYSESDQVTLYSYVKTFDSTTPVANVTPVTHALMAGIMGTTNLYQTFVNASLTPCVHCNSTRIRNCR